MNNRRLSASSLLISTLLALTTGAQARAQTQTPGSFAGGVPSGSPSSTVETITVVGAIARALEHNLGRLLAEEGVGRAQGARWRALAELLPNVNGRVSETRQQINLAAFGFGSGAGSPFPDIPTLVGPFNVFDARIYLS